MDRWPEVLDAMKNARDSLLLALNDLRLMNFGSQADEAKVKAHLSGAINQTSELYNCTLRLYERRTQPTTEGKTDGK